MLTQPEIDGMRATSASALPDVCTITRTAATATLEPDGDLVPDPPTTIYTGPCRVRQRDSQEQDTQVGDLHETLGPYVATLPALSTADGITAGDPNEVRVDDYLAVTTSSDPGMQGRAFQVRHVGWSSWQIDRRLGLDDREQPQGVQVAS